MTRRELIGTIIRGSLIASLTDVLNIFEGGMVMAQESEKKSVSSSQLPAYKGESQVKPLPFNPAKLPGLSEKLIVSHHQNNYGGAVRRLNQIQQQIGALPQRRAAFSDGLAQTRRDRGN